MYQPLRLELRTSRFTNRRSNQLAKAASHSREGVS